MPKRTNTRGGKTTPSNPTTFSSFGSASSRTDGSLSGEFRAEDAHGQATELNSAATGLDAEQSAMANRGNQSSGTPFMGDDPFRPTERPNEPATTGAQLGPGATGPIIPGNETDMALMAMYELTRDPFIKGLIRGQG